MFGGAIAVWKHEIFAGSWSWNQTDDRKGAMNLTLLKGGKGPGLILHKKHAFQTCFALNPSKTKGGVNVHVQKDHGFADLSVCERKKGAAE